jgi:hypothetical protein
LEIRAGAKEGDVAIVEFDFDVVALGAADDGVDFSFRTERDGDGPAPEQAAASGSDVLRKEVLELLIEVKRHQELVKRSGYFDLTWRPLM